MGIANGAIHRNSLTQPYDGGTGVRGLLLGKITANGILPMSSVKTNYGAAGAPTVSNDNTQGYGPGSEWTTGSSLYYCVTAATGAAVWSNLTAGGGTTVHSGRVLWTSTTPNQTIDDANVTASGAVILTVEGVDQYGVGLASRVASTSITVGLSSVPPSGTYINYLLF